MSAAPRILFFADAGAAVGGGHVMRCLTLADALMRQGATCAFAATPAAAGVLDVFAGPEIERLALPEGDPTSLAAPIGDLARGWGARGLVVDHFGFGPAEEAVARAGVYRLMALDDLKREHRCDLVLDPNPDRRPEDYPGVDSLVGPDFALVRREFADHRAAVLVRRKIFGPVRRVLVALGLTDVGGITGRVIEAILPVSGKIGFDVVVGRGAPSLAGLKAVAAGCDRLTLHVDTRDMARLTAAADFAIGAGGSSAWERCCLGVGTLTLVLADNQRDVARSLAAMGAAVVVDASEPDLPERLAEVFLQNIAAPAKLSRMGGAAAKICDGQGADRAAERFLGML